MTFRKTTVVPRASANAPVVLSLPEQSTPYEITRMSIEVNQYNVYISDEIGAPADYIGLIDLLRNAEAHDVFTFFLNTPGGRYDTGLQLLNAINDSAAHIVTALDSEACSMGAFLFLAGKEFIVPDTATLMFHNYSGGLAGKGNEQLAQVNAMSRGFHRLMQSTCRPFLSTEEINNILNGQDLWLDADNIRRRLNRKNEEQKAPTPRRRRATKGQDPKETTSDETSGTEAS